MGEFHLSKMQVLKEIYTREIPLIIYRLRMKRCNETLEKLYDQRLSLLIGSATAGMAPNPNLIEKLLDDIQVHCKI